MKILSSEQIREADQYTIKNEPVSSLDLMERASQACVDWVRNTFNNAFEFVFFCGPGNNGGDGLATARLLKQHGYRVHCYVLRFGEKISPDHQENYERLQASFRTDIRSASELPALREDQVLVDAIFGSGLNRPASGLAAAAIQLMNASRNVVVSIDIPSGMFTDKLNDKDDVIVNADHVLSFQFPKLSFMFPENASHIKEFSVLDIGLHPDFIQKVEVHQYFITKEDVRGFLKVRNKAAHKGNFGHALLIAGSKGKIGAAVLAARACMRTGAGLLTTNIPACGYEIMQRSFPEAMVISDEDQDHISQSHDTAKYSALGIGPGLDTDPGTAEALKHYLLTCKKPMVIDADALNMISANNWLDLIPEGSILTPHPKEFERFAGKTENSSQRLELQRTIAVQRKIHIILKGAHTSVADPAGRIFFNSTGNPGMATAGSGDVLTGMLTSLLAQGYSSLETCLLGVYLHGLAGDLVAKQRAAEVMIASDIIECIPSAYHFLHT